METILSLPHTKINYKNSNILKINSIFKKNEEIFVRIKCFLLEFLLNENKTSSSNLEFL